ncbi:MAG: hypothetical protein MJ204_09825 [Bacteroidales bacterium]|nr:hypothetical protein [Bacteroidales bacterium]
MAKPIRNTPVLYGDDATTFIKNAEKQRNEQQCLLERERIAQNVKKLQGLLHNLK